MALLNYTTEVPAERSVGEIQALLSKHGARRILIDSDGSGNTTSLAFQIMGPDGVMGFRLPAEWQRVEKVLKQQRDKARGSGQRFRVAVNEEQARRVAWRIIKVWLEAQLALLETQMVTLDQIFLPYAITRLGNTLYQEMKDSGHLLLPTGGNND